MDRSQAFSLPESVGSRNVLSFLNTTRPWILLPDTVPYDDHGDGAIDATKWDVTGSATETGGKIVVTGPSSMAYDSAGIRHKTARTSGYYIGKIDTQSSKFFVGAQQYTAGALAIATSVGIVLTPGRATPVLYGVEMTPLEFSWGYDTPIWFTIIMTSSTLQVRLFTASKDGLTLNQTSAAFSVPAPGSGWQFALNLYDSDATVSISKLGEAMVATTYSGLYITTESASEQVGHAGLIGAYYTSLLTGATGTVTAAVGGTSNLPVNSTLIGVSITPATSSSTGSRLYEAELALNGDIIWMGPLSTDVVA